VIAWDASLIRRMPIAGCTAQVSVCVLRQQDGEPSFEVTWSPRRPERLTHEDIALFDRFKAQAVSELRAELLALSSSVRRRDPPPNSPVKTEDHLGSIRQLVPHHSTDR
jgi:hypothetical protein